MSTEKAFGSQDPDLTLAVFGGEALRLALERSLTREQAEAIVLRALKVRGWSGKHDMPRHLVRRLAAFVGSMYVGATGRWEAVSEFWIFRLSEQFLLAEEHFNPRAGTCCSCIEVVAPATAQDYLCRTNRLEEVAKFIS